MSTANEAERRNALEVVFTEMEAARAMLAALKAIQALPTAAVDCVRGGVDLSAVIGAAEAAGITTDDAPARAYQITNPDA